ncbi:hypothetical protein BDR22DRAFT_890862 [Usnea florida]
MSPPVEAFPVSELEDRVNVQPNGRRRKGGDIDLRKCELLELVQYECGFVTDQRAVMSYKLRRQQPIVRCTPIVKLFRRCAGGLMVETTDWDDEGRG